jgi:hypothetical protein
LSGTPFIQGLKPKILPDGFLASAASVRVVLMMLAWAVSKLT